MANPFFSLSQAAKATGKSKSVLHTMLKNGRLSYASRENGRYRIDAAELFRVFPQAVLEPPEKNDSERNRTPKERAENAVLRTRIEGLEREIGHLERQRDDLCRRLDATDEERRRLTYMLVHQQQAARPAGGLLAWLGLARRER